MSERSERFIEVSLAPISIEKTEIILGQMKNCVCKIHKEGNTGSGFFLKIPYDNQLLNLLVTSNRVLNEKEIKVGNVINISLNNEKIFKEIKLDSKRKTYTNKELDITIIELKDEDNLQHFLLLDENIINNDVNNYNNIYKNESLYILNYLYNKDIYTLYSTPNKTEENKIIHKCNTDTSSSGSPIILLKNNKVIGIHCGNSKDNFNFGILLKKSLLDYMKLNGENKNINKTNKNYIIAEIDIKKEDIGKKIRNNIGIEEKDYYKYEN